MKRELAKVLSVVPLENYRLKIVLSNGKKGVYTMTPLLARGVFRKLKNSDYFSQVRPVFSGTGIGWPGGNDAPDLSSWTIEDGLSPFAPGESRKRIPRVESAPILQPISAFDGVVVFMPYPQIRKRKPRIVAECEGGKAEISIDSGKSLRGKLPPQKMKLLTKWLKTRRKDIIASWQMTIGGAEPFGVAPLHKPLTVETSPPKKRNC